MFENGAPAGTSAGVTKLLYLNNVIYQYNIYNAWWFWNGTGWSLSSSDPTGGTTSASTTGTSSSGGGTAQAGETLTADTSRPNSSTFVLGETVQLTFTANGMAASQSTTLNVSILDEYSNTITTMPVAMTSNSSGSASATVTAPASKLGYYRVNAALSDGTTMTMLGTRPAGFFSYAVVYDPSTRVAYGDATSHFGMQGGFNSAQGTILPYLGLRYYLSTAGSWSTLEPNQAGQFAAAKAAATAAGQQYPAKIPVVDAVTYNGAPWPTYSVATLASASIPAWAGPLAGTAGQLCNRFGALNSAGVSGFPAFASALGSEVAADYPNQSSHYYQITWEPESPWCYGGTPAQLVQYYQLVYSALHNADPKAMVTGPTLFPGDSTGQIPALFAAGLGSYIDALSMHPYVQYPPETNGLITSVRSQMQQATTAVGHPIPFIGTEHGLTSASGGEMNEALGDIRTTIILIGEGFKFDFDFYIADFWNNNSTETDNTYGFYWNLNPNIDYGTDKIGPKIAAPAYSAMTYLLDGTTTNGPVANLSGTQMGYRFTRNGTTILALWDYQASSSALSLPAPAGTIQQCNWMGNCTNTSASGGTLSLTLTAAPIYLVGSGL